MVSRMKNTTRNSMLYRLRHPKDPVDENLVSLDTESMGPEHLRLSECIACENALPADELLSEKDLYTTLMETLEKMPPRSREIIVMRFGIGMKEHTLKETASALGIEHHTARDCERAALDHVKRYFTKVTNDTRKSKSEHLEEIRTHLRDKEIFSYYGEPEHADFQEVQNYIRQQTEGENARPMDMAVEQEAKEYAQSLRDAFTRLARGEPTLWRWGDLHPMAEIVQRLKSEAEEQIKPRFPRGNIAP
jgi:hypothetical protein